MKTQEIKFRGLEDKNGKEIFKGDLVEGYVAWSINKNQPKVVCEVIWCNKNCGWRLSIGSGTYLISEIDQLKVIGNITGSPELLESKNE